MRRNYSQIKPSKNFFVTVLNTVWLYPESDITIALANSSNSFVYDGDFISCPDLANFIGVYSDIFNQTAISQPVGNTGFSIGVGSLLEDLGKEIRFTLQNGELLVIWRLVRQLTPQIPSSIIPSPGNSPNGTIGYVTTFLSYGTVPSSGPTTGVLDDVLVLQVG